MPKPAMAPVANMVMGKNLRPMKATRRPKVIALRLRIRGFLMKYLEKLLTENTGHAF